MIPYYKKYLLAVLVMAVGQLKTMAQQGFVSTGGDATGSSGLASYSAGQLAFQPVIAAGNIFIEGLQQPDLLKTGLPVTLLYFKAFAGGNRTVKLQWATLSEYHTDYFTVERSENAIDFSPLAKIPARGNSSTGSEYDALDRQPYTGNSYYRLAITDIDVKMSYSALVNLNLAAVPSAYYAGPNPARDFICIFMTTPAPGKRQYRVMDIQGRIQEEGILKGNMTQVDINRLAPAHYILQVLEKGKPVKFFTIVKQ